MLFEYASAKRVVDGQDFFTSRIIQLDMTGLVTFRLADEAVHFVPRMLHLLRDQAGPAERPFLHSLRAPRDIPYATMEGCDEADPRT